MANHTARERSIVIDANIIIQSPRLSSGAWRAAFQAQRSGSIRLLVPEVCLLEANAWVRREIPGRVRHYQKAAAALEDVGVLAPAHPWEASASDVERLASKAADTYEGYLRDRLGTESILPIPGTDHRRLIERALGRIKPFNDAGTGYRDALIWETVCAEAERAPVIFLSNNTRDFADEGALARSLQDDLAGRGLAPTRVTLQTSLLDIVKEFAPEATDATRVAAQRLSDTAELQRLEEAFAESFAGYEGIPYPMSPGELDPLLDDPIVESVWNLHDVWVDSAKPYGDSTYLVLGTVQGTGQAYSRRDAAGDADIRAAHAAKAAGHIDDFFVDGHDLVVIKLLPLVAHFEADFDAAGHLLDAGVTDLSRSS